MAKCYAAHIDPPELNFSGSEDISAKLAEYNRQQSEYLETMKADAQANCDSDLAGEVIRFPRGDGYAQYMVWQTKPLALIWIATGDAWQVEDALIRGLRVADVREMVERERNLASLFGTRQPVA